MAKITPYKKGAETITVNTGSKKTATQAYKWWLANSKADLWQQTLETVSFLKESQQYRYRQASIFSRLYGNMPLFNFVGANMSKASSASQLPIDRPTMNVVQSCIDTLVSRISQSRPRPVFLTDNGDYKERNLAKQMNSFINGELYQTHAYEEGALILRDAATLGTGCLKVYETHDKRVGLDRVMMTELLVDPNDSLYGKPRQLFQLKLVDKSVLKELFPEKRADIERAENGFPDAGSAEKTIADQSMIAEAWHLPSSKDATDGRHVIVCSSGVLFDEDYKKEDFPFVFLHYSPRIMGFWGQGLAEQLMGTQVDINKMLMTAAQSINVSATPRVWIEDSAKVPKAHINNTIGAIGTYRGTPPIFMTGNTGLGPDFYAHLQRLIEYAYQQSGISTLSATAQKPAGLNSGEAIRNYDDLQSDRFAALNRRFDEMFIKLSYQIIDRAKDIAEREGTYQTVYPNKDGAREIDLPEAERLEDPFVIQCFDASSLPRDPAGRLQKVTEMMQSGIVTPQEGRRLLAFPDLEQDEKLANAGEERILMILDEIVTDGKYTPPDPFMDPDMAIEKVTQYYNLYQAAKLEESKAQKLRDFYVQCLALKSAPMAGSQPGMGAPAPEAQAVPEARPTSELMPQIPAQQ